MQVVSERLLIMHVPGCVRQPCLSLAPWQALGPISPFRLGHDWRLHTPVHLGDWAGSADRAWTSSCSTCENICGACLRLLCRTDDTTVQSSQD